MEESTQFCPCTVCSRACKPILAILLIVMGVKMLASQFTASRKNKTQA